MRAEGSDNAKFWLRWDRWLLVTAILAAWTPLCRHYFLFADDFHFSEWFITEGIPIYFHELGVWRLLGHESVIGAMLVHPMASGVIGVLLQVTASLLFYALTRKFIQSRSLTLLLALLFAIYPWSEQNLTWAAAQTYVLATIFFFVVVGVMLDVFALRDAPAFLVCFFGALFSSLSNEVLFFELLICGGFTFFSPRQRSPKQKAVLAAAPILGCATWAALHLIFPGVLKLRAVTLAPRALVSAIFYQYTNLEIFQPWFHSGTRSLIFFRWTPSLAVAAALLIGAFFWCWKQNLSAPSQTAVHTRTRDKKVFLFFALLLVAGAVVYAISGGFSLDSRKKYTFIPILLWIAGCALEGIFRPEMISRMARRIIPPVALAGIATSWLQIALWRHEVERFDLLLEFLRRQPQPSAVRIDWRSRIQEAWPHCDRHWGVPIAGWIVENGISFKQVTTARPDLQPAAKSVHFDSDRYVWLPGS